ncbi:MAG: hypothetical protein M1358_20180 [Chloroflexi bacterium]|nr:hypothetical protein [Chloroflexota bacterium]
MSLLGLLILWVGLTITYGLVVKMSHEHLTAGSAMQWRAALSYVLAHLNGFLLGPIVFGIALFLVLAVEVVVLLLGRIPFLGEIVASLLFLPVMALNFGALVAVLFGSWLLFPVVAAEGAGGVRATMRVIELVRRRPAQVMMYGIVALLLGAVAMTVLFFLLILSLALTTGVSGVGLGAEKMAQIMDLGLLSGIIPGAGTMPFFRFQAPPFTIQFARFIFSLALAGFTALVYAFPLVFLLANSCSVYLTVQTQHVENAEARPSQGPMPLGTAQ